MARQATPPPASRPPNRRRGSRRVRAVAAFAATAALLMTLLTACGSTEPRNLLSDIRDGEVILGIKFDQPGLGMQTHHNDFVGFDVDVSRYVVNWIAEQNGWRPPNIEWRETPSAQRETLIANGEVDMIAATYSITSERWTKVTFAGPYLITYQALLVRDGDTAFVAALENPDIGLNALDGKILCSVAGSTSAQNVKTRLKSLGNVQLQQYDSYSSCVEALRRGKVDALTTDQSILEGYGNRYDGEFAVVPMVYPAATSYVRNGETVQREKGDPFSTEFYGIGMAKEHPEAVRAVNEALVAMMTPPAPGKASEWELSLRRNLGDAAVDRMIAMDRSVRQDPEDPDAYVFTPTPCAIEFLTPEESQQICPAGGGTE